MKFYKCCTPRLKGFGFKWGTEWPHRWITFRRVHIGVLLRWRDFFFGIGTMPKLKWFMALEMGPVVVYSIPRNVWATPTTPPDILDETATVK